MKRKSILIVLIVSILFIINGCTKEEVSSKETISQDLSFSVSYGYDKYVKYGRYMNVQASISNQGQDFQGKLQTVIPADDGNHILHEKEINIPAQGTIKVNFTVLFKSSYHTIDFHLVDREEKEVLSKKAKVNIINGMEKALVGVITEDAGSLMYLGNNATKVIHLEDEEISKEPLGYDTLDALVINDYDTSTLSDAQYTAIKEFVKNGGTLILGTGATAKKNLAIFDDGFIEIDKDEIAKKNVEPLFQSINVGKGNVQMVGLDTELDLSEKLSRRAEVDYRGYNNIYDIFNSLVVADDKNIPQIGIYIVILVLYTIVIGPFLYFILKKKDKRNYTWALVPTISIAFAILIFSLGSKTRMSAPYISYVNFVNINKDMTATDNTYLNITSPYNDNYSFLSDNKYHITNMTSQSGYYEMQEQKTLDLTEYKTIIHYGVVDTKIMMKDLKAFAPVYFETTSTVNMDGSYNSDLEWNDFDITGTFTNRLGFDLSNAAIYSNHTLVNVGDIKNQETTFVSNKEQVIITSRDNLASSKMVGEIAGGNAYEWGTDAATARRYYALEYFINSHFDDKENASYLIGFDYSPAQSGIVKDLGLKNWGSRIIIIPVEVNTTKDGKTYLPQINSYMNVVSGEYDSNYGYILSDQLKVDYQFNKDDTILSLLYSKELNEEFLKDEEHWSGFYGSVTAYNYKTKQYDGVFLGGHEGERKDLTNYINEFNVMTLVFTVDKAARNKYTILIPTISAIKEVR